MFFIVWSFGMVLYELLTLDIPYRAENLAPFLIPERIENGIRPEVPTSIQTRINEDVGLQEIKKLFMECTEKDVVKRLCSKEVFNRFKMLSQTFPPK